MPTASSITVLPAALGLIQGERTKENLLRGVRAAQSRHPGVDSEGAVRQRRGPRVHLRRRARALQPAQPGDRRLRHPGAARGLGNVGVDIVGRAVGGRQSAGAAAQRASRRVRAGSVHGPARHAVHGDATGSRRRASTPSSRRSIRSRIRPAWRRRSRCAAPIATGTLAISRHDDVRRHDRSTSCAPACSTLEQLAPAGRSVPVAHERRLGVPNPATFFDSPTRRLRLGHYIGGPGTIMERFSFGGPNDTFNRRQQQTYHYRRHAELDQGQPRASVRRRVPPQRLRHEPAGRAGDGVREVRELHA